MKRVDLSWRGAGARAVPPPNIATVIRDAATATPQRRRKYATTIAYWLLHLPLRAVDLSKFTGRDTRNPSNPNIAI